MRTRTEHGAQQKTRRETGTSVTVLLNQRPWRQIKPLLWQTRPLQRAAGITAVLVQDVFKNLPFVWAFLSCLS